MLAPKLSDANRQQQSTHTLEHTCTALVLYKMNVTCNKNKTKLLPFSFKQKPEKRRLQLRITTEEQVGWEA